MTTDLMRVFPKRRAAGTSAGTPAAFAKTVSYPFLLTPNLAMKRQKE